MQGQQVNGRFYIDINSNRMAYKKIKYVMKWQEINNFP